MMVIGYEQEEYESLPFVFSLTTIVIGVELSPGIITWRQAKKRELTLFYTKQRQAKLPPSTVLNHSIGPVKIT